VRSKRKQSSKLVAESATQSRPSAQRDNASSSVVTARECLTADNGGNLALSTTVSPALTTTRVRFDVEFNSTQVSIALLSANDRGLARDERYRVRRPGPIGSGGKFLATPIRHARALPQPVLAVAVTVVEPPFRAPLVLRVRDASPPRHPRRLALLTAVLLPALARSAGVEELEAPAASTFSDQLDRRAHSSRRARKLTVT
jgi:hypothetical protein